MTVFLRWGIFGILAVAAMVYAYNASKRMAENRQSRPAPVASQDQAAEEPDDSSASAESSNEDEEDEPVDALPKVCEEERQVAERALKMRRDGEPLDRLLRMQLIVFQTDDLRRSRLQDVAKHWFERPGADPNAATVRGEVLRDCQKASRAP